MTGSTAVASEGAFDRGSEAALLADDIDPEAHSATSSFRASATIVYRAQDAEAGMTALDEFEAGYWGQRYPAIAQSWRRNWEHVVPFFAFPESVRRIIYTTNAIEALNSKLRRAVRTCGQFPRMTMRP